MEPIEKQEIHAKNYEGDKNSQRQQYRNKVSKNYS